MKVKKGETIKNRFYPLFPRLKVAHSFTTSSILSCRSKDMNLVVDKIYQQLWVSLGKLTKQDQQLVYTGDKHFRLGFALRYEVMHCVEESSTFIAVISKDFCRKHWCNLEVGWVHDQNKPNIMLMVERVKKKLKDQFLKKVFDQYAYASWTYRRWPYRTRLEDTLHLILSAGRKWRLSWFFVHVFKQTNLRMQRYYLALA